MELPAMDIFTRSRNDQINDRNFFGENGDFTFDGSESGSDVVDFFLGAPSQFIQASEQILDSRSKHMGLYGQDSWRITQNLTFNYGLRWEFSQPWYDTQNKIIGLCIFDATHNFVASYDTRVPFEGIFDYRLISSGNSLSRNNSRDQSEQGTLGAKQGIEFPIHTGHGALIRA
jgi:hypothetical protein